MQDWIFDEETYPNAFTIGFLGATTKEAWVFEISDRKDQRKQLLDFLRRVYKEKGRMVGFNNLGFDYPVLHYLIKNQDCSVYSLYRKAMSIIEAQDEDRFKNMIKTEDMLIPQIDLFKIHHFDNKARATSLKVLEFNMRSDSIEDLPFPVGKNLSFKEIDMLIKYMQHDILQTYEFYKHSLPLIKFREELTKKYDRDFMNHNDTKIGKDYFIMRLEEKQEGCCYKVDSHGRRKIQQTRRKSIPLKDCIFPYVKFERPEFNAVLEWFKQQDIKETKGVFSDILECDLGDVAKYANLTKKEKKLKDKPSEEEVAALMKDNPKAWIEERVLKSKKTVWYVCWNIAETLNVVINGFQYDFGVGGIHGSISGGIVVADDEYEIVDADVASMYPNLAISNRVYPEHLGTLFCEIYRDMYLQRKSYDKKSAENAMLKLALNGTYGDSNNEYSPFYDPKFTMSITVNGQLSLCMLAEQLLKIDGLNVIQVNTDGITVRLPKNRKEDYVKICNWWQGVVKLELEFADYSKMCVRDVNNYVALYTNGKVKLKGAYEHSDLGWNKNHSSLVIPKAAEAALIHGKDIEEFVMNHQDRMDFMLRVKVPRSNKLISIDDFGVEQQEQNICRYYVSNSGVELVKIMPALDKEGKKVNVYANPETGEEVQCKTEAEIKKFQKKGFTEFKGEIELPNEERPQQIEAGRKVSICNNMKEYKGDINYQYYIDEAKKLVDTLKLFNFKQQEETKI